MGEFEILVILESWAYVVLVELVFFITMIITDVWINNVISIVASLLKQKILEIFFDCQGEIWYLGIGKS